MELVFSLPQPLGFYEYSHMPLFSAEQVIKTECRGARFMKVRGKGI